MFDTHAHLNIPPLLENYQRHIGAGKEVGVSNVVVPGTSIQTSKAAVRIAGEFSKVYAVVGIHPTENFGKLDLDKTIYQLEEMVTSDVVGIGEVGLDYYKFKSAPDIQKKWLSAQIKLANKLGLAISLHNRQAEEDMLNIIEANWTNAMKYRVVFHCCEADEKLLDFAKRKKIYMGVCGDITFDKTKQEFVKKIPNELLVVETDSPYLTPDPVRKTSKFPNKPENLVHIVEFISKLLDVSVDELISSTTRNANVLYGK